MRSHYPPPHRTPDESEQHEAVALQLQRHWRAIEHCNASSPALDLLF
jgi:hypothetical protein